MTDEIEQVPGGELDGDVDEAWQRLTDDPDVRGVEASRDSRSEWPWHVTIWAAEFVRDEPLESTLRRRLESALRAVDGATEVVEEDREVWLVAGTPSGRALVEAAASVVDELADEIATAMEADR